MRQSIIFGPDRNYSLLFNVVNDKLISVSLSESRPNVYSSPLFFNITMNLTTEAVLVPFFAQSRPKVN